MKIIVTERQLNKILLYESKEEQEEVEFKKPTFVGLDKIEYNNNDGKHELLITFSVKNNSRLNLKIKDYIKKQSETKIFFCPIFTTPRWGNSIIEAAMCKSLIVGNKNSYWNSLLIHPDLHCTSVSKGRKIIIKVLSNKKIYNYYISQQNKLLDKINYRLPMQQISKLLD